MLAAPPTTARSRAQALLQQAILQQYSQGYGDTHHKRKDAAQRTARGPADQGMMGPPLLYRHTLGTNRTRPLGQGSGRRLVGTDSAFHALGSRGQLIHP